MTTLAPSQTYLSRALSDGHAEITGEGRNERIRYIAADRSERWAELVYKYDYPPEHIGVEVTIPGRTPNHFADLVLYEDDGHISPYFVFECKRPDFSDAAFEQAIEQACGYRASLGANFCGVVAGLTRRLLRFDHFPPGEHDHPPHREGRRLLGTVRPDALSGQEQSSPRRDNRGGGRRRRQARSKDRE